MGEISSKPQIPADMRVNLFRSMIAYSLNSPDDVIKGMATALNVGLIATIEQNQPWLIRPFLNLWLPFVYYDFDSLFNAFVNWLRQNPNRLQFVPDVVSPISNEQVIISPVVILENLRRGSTVKCDCKSLATLLAYFDRYAEWMHRYNKFTVNWTNDQKFMMSRIKPFSREMYEPYAWSPVTFELMSYEPQKLFSPVNYSHVAYYRNNTSYDLAAILIAINSGVFSDKQPTARQLLTVGPSLQNVKQGTFVPVITSKTTFIDHA